jgi:hypothetical protein
VAFAEAADEGDEEGDSVALNEHYWFAFTVPAIDRWLGTGPDPHHVARSPTVRSLDQDP